MNLVSFDVHLLDKDGNAIVLTLPIGPALEVTAACHNVVIKLVPNYGVSSVSSHSDKE